MRYQIFHLYNLQELRIVTLSIHARKHIQLDNTNNSYIRYYNALLSLERFLQQLKYYYLVVIIVNGFVFVAIGSKLNLSPNTDKRRIARITSATNIGGSSP